MLKNIKSFMTQNIGALPKVLHTERSNSYQQKNYKLVTPECVKLENFGRLEIKYCASLAKVPPTTGVPSRKRKN
jgi:hypothetical protein